MRHLTQLRKSGGTRHAAPRTRERTRPFAILLALLAFLPLAACARRAPEVPAAAAADHADHADHASHGAPAGAESGASAVMGGAMLETPHLRLTPPRPASASDSARAREIGRVLRLAVARYEKVDSAVADGYEQFAPQLKRQRVFHFTKRGHALRNELGFDPARPTSLLYARDAKGGLRLTGAMYTAPRRSSLAQLDARVPLGIAQWHLHTNVCVPGRGERERWGEMRDGRMVFGLLSPIATEAACTAVGGRFHEAVFNWMVHANFAADGSVTWGVDHAAHAGMEGHAH